MGAIFLLVYLAIIIAVLFGMYKTFKKMGYDDAWWVIIPILNIVFMLKVIEKPIWWIVLLFIPIVSLFVGIYVGWLVASKVAAAYGKSTGFAVGLLLLGFIFYPMLGLTDAQPVRAS